jgi:hypothetical protein
VLRKVEHLIGLILRKLCQKRTWKKRQSKNQRKNKSGIAGCPAAPSVSKTCFSKGIPVVNVKENPSAFPPEEGIICLGDRDRETAEKYTNGHVPKSTQTMLENYLKNSCVIMLNQPTVVITVLPLLTDIMRITLNAQHELQQSTKYGQLPSGNPAPVGPAS